MSPYRPVIDAVIPAISEFGNDVTRITDQRYPTLRILEPIGAREVGNYGESFNHLRHVIDE
jgi:hypothetical protein